MVLINRKLIFVLKVLYDFILLFSYRSKCRKYEQKIEEITSSHKTKEAELAKESARSKEIEISNLKLQKERQMILFEVENLKQELSEREEHLAHLLGEKSHTELVLTQANANEKYTTELKVRPI